MKTKQTKKIAAILCEDSETVQSIDFRRSIQNPKETFITIKIVEN